MNIAGFNVEELISNGKNFTIYRVVASADRTPCILKIIKNVIVSSAKKDLLREYEFLKEINSAYVIRALGWLEDKDYIGIIMEDIAGQDLHTIFKQKQLPFETLTGFAASIVQGLVDIHARGIIHMDINPANIIWNQEKGLVKIIDFSIATHFSTKVAYAESGTQFRGTLPYISPEQSGRMNHAVDQRTDLYSLGVLLYEMFTGRLPFIYDNPVELLHAHLARTPEPPHLFNTLVPPVLSSIILKLLAKSPEDRYQSAEGLLFDLQKTMLMNFAPFPLASRDFSGLLRIPEKLYGREQELKKLLTTYQSVCEGNKVILMVEGYSGTGKTSLINEIQIPVTRDRGFFLRSKFDQFSGGMPYSALVEVLNQFCNIVLRGEVKSFLYWQERISKAMGNAGKILTDLAPLMKALIGPQPDLPVVGELEEQRRIYFILQCFFKTISTAEHPVVIFIDDMQWGDLASINLFHFLLNDQNLRYFLFIGAYRSNEVSSLHPLRETIDDLSRTNDLETIVVNNLNVEHVRTLITATLGDNENEREIAELADLIYEKTAGNPFFTIRLFQNLYEEKLIQFNYKECKWTCDLNGLINQEYSENVIDLLVKNLNTFPVHVIETLKFAACIGNKFDLEILSVISEKEKVLLESNLETAVSRKLIYPAGDEAYQFVHDRIQQASYSLVRAQDRKKLHLKIGRLLLNGLNNSPALANEKRESYVFTIVSHLNKAIEFIVEQEERLLLLHMNLDILEMIEKSAAYKMALDYIQYISNLLPVYTKEHHPLFLKCYNQLLKIYYSTGAYDKLEETVDLVKKIAKDHREYARADEYLMKSYIARNQAFKAIDTTLANFKAMNIHIPRSPSEDENKAIMVRTAKALTEKGPNYIKKLVATDDEQIRFLMKLSCIAGTIIFFAAPELERYVYCTLILLIMEKGLTEESPYYLSLYAMKRAANWLDNSEAFKLGEDAEYLMANGFGSRAMEVKTDTMICLYTYSLKHPFKTLYKKMSDTYFTAINLGDFEFASYLIVNSLFCLHATDTFLLTVSEKMNLAEKSLSEINQTFFSDTVKILKAFTNALLGKTERAAELDIDKQRLLESEAIGTRLMNSWHAYDKAVILAVLFEKYDHLAADLEKAEEYCKLMGAPCPYIIINNLFYYSIGYLRLTERSGNANEKDSFLAKVCGKMEILKKWADLGEENFQHKYLLLQAEFLRISGKEEDAEKLYDESIEKAILHEFTHDAALASELAARYYMQKGSSKLACLYLTQARRFYAKWGANAKVKQLENNFPKYLDSHLPFIFTDTIASSFTTGSMLDIKSILKASSILSSEVDLEKLLSKLISILLENAGAQRCIFLENKKGELLLQGEGTIDGIPEILQAQSVDNSAKVPLPVINYVARSQKKLVFDNLSASADYAQDKYIQKYSPRSVVCFPVVSKGELVAIIYLENNLVEGAFNRDRLELISMLSSQIAISIENAQLYKEQTVLSQALQQEKILLEQRVAERTRELEIANQALKEQDIAKTNFFANISHELRTPLALIRPSLEAIMGGVYGKSLPINHPLFTIIYRNSGKLLRQVNNLLDFASIELDMKKPDFQTLELGRIIAFFIAEIDSLARSKDLHLDFIYDKEQTFIVKLDPALFETAFFNIISNAFKFTPPHGAISLCLEAKQGNAVLSITDTGPGLPDESQIFERFFQGREDTRNKKEGTGIGLAVTREIILLMNGQITACNNPGGGATFTISLPIAREEGSQDYTVSPRKELMEELSTPNASLQHPFSFTRNHTLLIIDDNPDMQSFLVDLFKEDYNILTACNGEEGLKVLAQKIPINLIITDVMMPRMDGYNFVESVKKEKTYKHIPILFLSARSGADESIRGLTYGAADYISKPFSVQELKAKVRNLTLMEANQKEELLLRVMDSLTEKPSLPDKKPDYRMICKKYQLSERQQEIFFLIIEGLTNKEIAARFDIAESTIRRHISDIYLKFDVTTRLELLNRLKSLME